jgi:hypothetical protein
MLVSTVFNIYLIIRCSLRNLIEFIIVLPSHFTLRTLQNWNSDFKLPDDGQWGHTVA